MLVEADPVALRARPTSPARSPRSSEAHEAAGHDLRPGPARQRRRRHRRLPGRHPARLRARPAGGQRRRDASRSTATTRRPRAATARTGTETYEVPLPAVVTVLEGGVEPRYPSITGPDEGQEGRRSRPSRRAASRSAPAGCGSRCRPPQPSTVEVLGEGPEAAPAVVDLLQRAGGGPMILVFVETDADGRRPRCRWRPSPSPARSPTRAAACRSHAVVVGACPDDAGRRARRVRRRRGAPRRPATRSRPTPAPPGRPRSWTPRGRRRPVGRDGRAAPPRGNEVLAHVAARLDVPMAANVVVVRRARRRSWSPARCVGGAALEEMRLPERPAVLTVAGHAVEAAARPRRRRPPTVREHCPEVRRGRPAWPASCRPSRAEPGRVRRAQVGAGRGRRRSRCRGRRRVRRRARAGRAARRRARRLPRRDQPRLAPAPRAGRPDRQPDLPRALHPLRHQRRHPALGRLLELEDDPGDQHRRRTRRW